MYDWDEAKRQTNLAKHGVDFTTMVGFDWATAEKQVDDRRDYGNCAWPRGAGLVNACISSSLQSATR